MGVCCVEIGDEMVPLKRDRERKKEISHGGGLSFDFYSVFITPRGSFSKFLFTTGKLEPKSVSQFLFVDF